MAKTPDFTINRLDNGNVCLDLTGFDAHRVKVQHSRDAATWTTMEAVNIGQVEESGRRVIVTDPDAASYWYRLMLVDSAGRVSYGQLKRWMPPVEPAEAVEFVSTQPEWRYAGAVALIDALVEAVDGVPGHSGHRPCLRDCLGDLAEAMRSDRDAVTDRVVDVIFGYPVEERQGAAVDSDA